MADNRDAAHAALHAALMMTLADSIERLPAPERTAFIWRYVRQAPTSEIAQHLNLSTTEVQARCVRALASCRAALAGANLDAFTELESRLAEGRPCSS